MWSSADITRYNNYINNNNQFIGEEEKDNNTKEKETEYPDEINHPEIITSDDDSSDDDFVMIEKSFIEDEFEMIDPIDEKNEKKFLLKIVDMLSVGDANHICNNLKMLVTFDRLSMLKKTKADEDSYQKKLIVKNLSPVPLSLVGAGIMPVAPYLGIPLLAISAFFSAKNIINDRKHSKNYNNVTGYLDFKTILKEELKKGIFESSDQERANRAQRYLKNGEILSYKNIEGKRVYPENSIEAAKAYELKVKETLESDASDSKKNNKIDTLLRAYTEFVQDEKYFNEVIKMKKKIEQINLPSQIPDFPQEEENSDRNLC